MGLLFFTSNLDKSVVLQHMTEYTELSAADFDCQLSIIKTGDQL